MIANITNAIQQASRQLEGGPAGLESQEAPKEDRKPAVPVRKSVHEDHLVCLDCGKPHQTLKRHLQSAHGLTPQQYREHWGLARDYPLVAPAYSASRSAMAKKIGLGAKGREGAAKQGSKRPRGKAAA